MANITVSDMEIDMLEDILLSYLSDLRMEIADTDQKDFRQSLKDKENFIKGFLQRLGEMKS
jgi:hypothetical protein